MKSMNYAGALLARGPAAIVLLVHLIAFSAQADVIYVVDGDAGKVGLYSGDGTPINPNLITGLSRPYGVAVSGTDLYVSSFGNGPIFGGKVGKYTTTGDVINADLVTGLAQPQSIGVSGTNLFVGFAGEDYIGKYTTGGATIDSRFIAAHSPAGLSVSASSVYAINIVNSQYRIGQWSMDTGAPVAGYNPPLFTSGYGTTVHGSDLYAVYASEVRKYNAATGALTATVISGLFGGGNYGVAVSDTSIYVSRFNPEALVAKYDLSGALVNPNLIAGLEIPYGIAVAPDSVVPEPVAAGILLVVGLDVLSRRR